MNKRTVPFRIGTLLTGVNGILFITASVLTIVLVNYNMRQQALIEAEEKMRLILDRNMAVHSYFSQILKPDLFAWSEPFRPADYFDPSWMSSTYAVREMGNFFEELSPTDYYYKDAAVNARSPENEADVEERAFIEELKTDPSLQERSSVRTLDGKPYLVVLRPGEVLEESCLLCHGTPQDAPTDLVRQYGAERSFQREAELGKVISAVSVRVPLVVAYEDADRVSLQLSLLLLGLMGLLFAVQFWLSKRLIFMPLAVLREKALEISTDEQHLGEQISTPIGAELGMVARAFNIMSVKLRDDRDHLEARVQERTADLERTEETLRQEKDFAESLIATAQIIVLVLDTQGRIVRFNPYFEEISGYALAEVQGKDWFTTFLPERDRETTRALFLKVTDENQTHGYINPIVTKDGREREIEWNDTMLRDGQGDATGLLVIGQDVTERKQQETQLLTARVKTDQLLDEANQSRRALLSLLEDQKQAEQAVRESEKRFRALIENSSDAITLLDASGIVIYDSPAAPGLLGYGPDDWIGQDVFTLIHPDDLPGSRELFQQVVKSPGDRVNLTLRVRHNSGSWSWMEMSVTNLLAEPGVKAIVLNYRDITERKRAEAALIESEERFRTWSENSSDVITVVGVDGTTQYQSPSIEHMLGYKPEELVGTNVFDLIHPDDRQRLMEILAQTAQKAGSMSGAEFRIRHRDGSWRIFESLGKTILNEQGQMIGLINSRDITERKQTEQKLVASEAQLRALFASMQDVVLVIDREGVYREVAPTNPVLLLQPLEELLGKNLRDIFPAGQVRLFIDAILQVLESRQTTHIEYEVLIGGRSSWFAAAISPMDEQRTLWVAHDITQSKHAEEMIRRQVEHLTALSAIDRIISTVFDLKTNLSEILSYVTKELEIDAADILVFNPVSLMLEYCAESGFRTETIRKAQVRLGESYAGRAALERQLVQIPNLKKDEPNNRLLTDYLTGEDFVCYYGVPLIAKGEVKGVLEVFHRTVLEPDVEWFDFLDNLAGRAALAIENVMLFESLLRSNLDLSLAYDATIEGWSRAMDLRDKETEGHTQRVTRMTMKLMAAFGSSEAEQEQARWGALLHDIGKMGVPDGILLKPGSLTEDEWVLMRMHPTFAYEMLAPIHYLHLALDIPYCHHEKWDGTGYPRGLKGEQIPLPARIFAVVDVYDALTSDRPYRKAWLAQEVVAHIRSGSGTHFDPQVVKVFLEEFGITETGSQPDLGSMNQ